MKLLLHACCAPCSIQCVEALAADEIQPDLFWYNPNIHPYTEYRARADALKKFAEEKKLPLLIEDEYGLRAFIYGDWHQNLTHRRLLENSSRQGEEDVRRKRCAFCYKLRLEKTARLATEKGYEAFSTTLLISPYQNHDLIRQTGGELASMYGIEFLYRDFRPKFREGREQARAAGYYMQKYCGCIFSEEERYLGGGE